MNLKSHFHNIDISKDISLPVDNEEIISKIKRCILDLPSLNIINDDFLLDYTIKEVKEFSNNKKNFLLFGTGGSNLGAKALINTLGDICDGNIFFFDNIDPISFSNSIQKIDLNDSGFIFISKSGSTPETLSQFATLIELFKNDNNLEYLFSSSLIITENKPSPLLEIAKDNKCKILHHKVDIGGRFSVFSNVGMVPAIIAGLDVKKIHEGVLSVLNKKTHTDCLKIAQLFRFQNLKNNLTNTVFMTYSDSLFFFGKWYLQLWAESLGKNGKGITPIHAVGTIDQHSQLQLYLDGPKDKFFTFITTNHSNKGLLLNEHTMKKYKIDYLAGKKMGDLMQAEQQATIDTFKKNGFPLREIHINEINEYTIGQLMALCIMETVATCIYFDVDPFDQPAVEQGKLLTKKYLS